MSNFEEIYNSLPEEQRKVAREFYKTHSLEHVFNYLLACKNFDLLEKEIDKFVSYLKSLADSGNDENNGASATSDEKEEEITETPEQNDSEKADEPCAEESVAEEELVEEDKNKKGTTDEPETMYNTDKTTLFRDLETITPKIADSDGHDIIYNARVKWLEEFAQKHLDEWSTTDRYGKSRFKYAEDVIAELWNIASDGDVDNSEIGRYCEVTFERDMVKLFVPHVRTSKDYLMFVQSLIKANYNIDASVTYDSTMASGKATAKKCEAGMTITIYLY